PDRRLAAERGWLAAAVRDCAATTAPHAGCGGGCAANTVRDAGGDVGDGAQNQKARLAQRRPRRSGIRRRLVQGPLRRSRAIDPAAVRGAHARAGEAARVTPPPFDKLRAQGERVLLGQSYFLRFDPKLL